MRVPDLIPTNEIDALTTTVTDALDLAAEGQVADGYAALVRGLRRSEEMVEEGIADFVIQQVLGGKAVP